MNGRADRWIGWMATGCLALLAPIAATISNLHMRMLAELHGQPGCVAALTPFSVDGVIAGGVDHVAGRFSCGGARGLSITARRAAVVGG
jgi:hypothetical protein